jgi:hypothetical protein
MASVRRRSRGTDWLGLLSFGFFVVILGTVWMLTPNLTDEAVDFAKDFHLQNVTSNIALPEPQNNHPVLYTAAMQFCFLFGISQIVILVLRFALHDSLDKKAGDTSGIAFWFSAGYFPSLLAIGSIGWFGFIAGIVISVGLAIIVSSLVKLAG